MSWGLPNGRKGKKKLPNPANDFEEF